MSIISEFPDEIGLQLWLLFRNALMWAESEPHERRGIFSEGAKERAVKIREIADPEMRDRLLPLAAMLERPGRISGSKVRRACARVAAWAEAQGKLGTALAWARGAATADPQSAWMAYKVGTLARRRAEYHVAEVWLYHAIDTGRRYKQWLAYVAAQIALGNLFAQRGEYEKARGVLERALRASGRPAPKAGLRGMRPRLRDMRRRALHDLMVVEMDSGHYMEAERYARDAYGLMRPWHPRMPVLAHDVAYLWILRGHFARALPVLRAVLRVLSVPMERALAAANLARAAGATGNVDLFASAWQEAASVLRSQEAHDTPAWVPLNLARGAANLGRWSEAMTLARCVRRSIEERQEHDRTGDLNALLGAIEGGRAPDWAQADLSPWEARKANAFAAGLVASLEAAVAGA
jgi:tetratricopeptide (TPR) repeat protein